MTTSISAVGTAPPATYSGRVDCFYSSERCLYCETYEPARPTAYGTVGRIESRLVSQRWRHAAYDERGKRISVGCRHDFALFDQETLPLFFDPEQMVMRAKTLLTAVDKHLLTRPNGMVVYGNKDLSSVGIICLKYSR